ncbi:MAG: 30S ribosomal protein S6 [Saprospiraceae bacterium]|nr:30S ribosomal protein S6 [Saprospiraceae bacterium]
MNQYEVTFIVDPVLSSDEIVGTAQTYVDHLQSEGCKIVHVDEMGLRQLAYPLRKRTTGVYYGIEFSTETGQIIERMELAFRRDERIIRFLTVKLDKYGIKYNEDKRNGLIGKKRSAPATVSEESDGRKKSGRGNAGVDTKAKSASSNTKSSKPSKEEEE